ncbi:DUF4235 domain-containing protein [Dermatophilus congolensis]|uniref:DUF4235 domain-containing protein n=1 Tax=Dermatophilus congolensis TaxID=1863 RepID=UPI001AAFB799|nr:DUF4235 domain-containing protein [Dermatophilus congolensis]MBO3143563.1 DUF4235 domain-containing protein [Dermatophilus congolensis]MBO3152555.1 DUF4235 domain-containing protein [Dermatophilus congolensis]MBO3160434.1 DUF4235 domain-containing protein [Dermatophilus congolensis]MBO3163840.1 DUF4235 domain-containing protein [Dermatophilus congolensis]MBO3177387.1 DUF4235 domain-containing protein [Dermatophilus congolensis]
MNEKIFDLVGTGVALAAGAVANKLVGLVWRGVVGEPPENPDDPEETSFAEAMGFAILSAVFMATFKLIASRKLHAYYNDSKKPLGAPAENS